MPYSKIILSVVAVLLVIGLFLLPKVVVDNTEAEGVSDNTVNPETSPSSSGNSASLGIAAHDAEIPAEDETILTALREKIKDSGDNEKSAIFADSLANVFRRNNKMDSAARYSALAVDFSPSKERLKKAGDLHYEAFTFAVDAGRSAALAEKTQEYYSKVMDLSSEEEALDLKARLAMTYIASSTPMKGISMLTEIIDEDPEHEQALFNLGILSIQSGQYGKAIDRFEKLKSLYPDNLQAQFYLGLSYMEAGKKKEARKQFEEVKELDKDPEVQATVDAYLQEM